MRPPVVVGVGAVLAAGGAVAVARFADRTTEGCASVGVTADGKVGTSFVPHCFEPGMAMVGGLVLVIGGAVLLAWGLWSMLGSWRQRVHRRALGHDVLPAVPGGAQHLRRATGHPQPSDASFASGSTAAISPPPGWYAVSSDHGPMWWDGHAWATAPTLPSVPAAAHETR